MTETVIHLISTTVPKTANEDPVFDINTNLIATVKFLDLLKGTDVKKLVYVLCDGLWSA